MYVTGGSQIVLQSDTDNRLRILLKVLRLCYSRTQTTDYVFYWRFSDCATVGHRQQTTYSTEGSQIVLESDTNYRLCILIEVLRLNSSLTRTIDYVLYWNASGPLVLSPTGVLLGNPYPTNHSIYHLHRPI